METIHKSDCGLHNEPAFKQTNCDCGAIENPIERVIMLLNQTIKDGLEDNEVLLIRSLIKQIKEL